MSERERAIKLIIIIKLFRELTIKLTVIELIKLKLHVFFGIRLKKIFGQTNAFVYVRL